VDLERVGFAANGDATLVIDLLDGEIVAIFGIGAVQRILSGERDSRAEGDDVVATERPAPLSMRLRSRQGPPEALYR